MTLMLNHLVVLVLMPKVIHFLSQLWMLLNQQMLSSWLQLVDQNMTMRQFVLSQDQTLYK